MTYISTAYVAGEHRGVFREQDFDLGQRFRNAYEQSKFEAEQLVRAAARARPAGHRDAAEHHRRRPPQRLDRVVQRPLLAAARAGARRLPAAARARRRAGRRRLGGLRRRRDLRPARRCPAPPARRITSPRRPTRAASASCSISRSSASAAAARRSWRRSAYRRIVHPLAVRASPRRRRRFLRATESYLPYFAMRVRYDDAQARAALGEAIAAAPLPDYFDRLVDYALLARWGARPIGRAEALDALPRERPSGARPVAGVVEPAALPNLIALTGRGGASPLDAREPPPRSPASAALVLAEHARRAAGAGMDIDVAGPFEQLRRVERRLQAVAVRHGAVAAHQRSPATRRAPRRRSRRGPACRTSRSARPARCRRSAAAHSGCTAARR